MRFFRDDRGNVAVMFAFSLPIMVACVGGALDVGRWYHAKSQTQSAIDAAVLAGARSLQVNPDSFATATEAARQIYLANVKNRPWVQGEPSAKFTVVEQDGAKVLDGVEHSIVKTMFLPIVHVEKLDINVAARSQVRKGGKTGGNLEVALMLDVTGSMCSPCSKLDAMKDAAKDLINVVVDENQSDVTSKAAIIPFSESVNLGSRFSTIMSGAPTAAATKSIQQNNGKTRDWRRTSYCVVERTGSQAYTDAPPSSANGYPMRPYTYDGKCEPASVFIPLSSDKQMIMDAIDNLKASGSTAGHIGTAWAYYALSPNWAARFPSNARPQAYDPSKKSVRKVAVLMTDGEYNIQHCSSGAADKTSNRTDDLKGKCSAANGSSATQAREICKRMKADGIDVFTIGFKLDDYTAKETLSQCATDATMKYDAADDAQLRQAFRDIALKISDIYLSK